MRCTHQAIYKDRPVIVAMGWDNILQGWFMIILPADDDNPDVDEESGMVYSNLGDSEIPFPGLTVDMDHYKKRLREMKIDVPQSFFDLVYARND